MNDMQVKEVNFRKLPYKGAITELAKELGTSRENASQKYTNGNPEVVQAMTKILERREKQARKKYIPMGASK